MNIYFAPMEGITGYPFRNLFNELFGGVDKYFTPFISPMEKKPFRNREKRDVDPVNNQGLSLVPQIITNNADNFIKAAYVLGKNGYKEINLNLGCPSNTVVAKSKGSGMLRDPNKLDALLDGIFTGLSDLEYDINLSVKTRLGLEDPEEFKEILKVYNKYTLSELIIHPRVKKQLYAGNVHMDIFDYAYEHSANPICYNGDVLSVSDFLSLKEKYEKLTGIMIGRGLLINPCLASEIKESEAKGSFSKMLSGEKLFKFHDRLYELYLDEMSGERDVVFKMKELWFYFGKNFDDEKTLHKILISKKVDDYKECIAKLKSQTQA